MVTVAFGDALTCPGDILCHQVNYEGIMGGGIAYAIRKRILPKKEYEEYERRCLAGGSANLGTVLWSRTRPGSVPKYVANMFCQYAFDPEDEESDELEDDSLTAYTFMRRCFEEVRQFAERKKLTVVIPGFIGCGIAGGDWGRVSELINEVFMQSSVTVRVCYLEKQIADT